MRIGTRGSALALAQARLVSGWLGGGEIVHEHYRRGRARGPGGDKSRWVHELEQALLAGEIDLAVHSAKDVPGELAGGLELLGAPHAATAEDALCGARSLEELPAGAHVGTSSVRRAAQLRAARPDLERGRACAATSIRACASSNQGEAREAGRRGEPHSTRSCWRAPGCGGWAARATSAPARRRTLCASAWAGHARAAGAHRRCVREHSRGGDP